MHHSRLRLENSDCPWVDWDSWPLGNRNFPVTVTNRALKSLNINVFKRTVFTGMWLLKQFSNIFIQIIIAFFKIYCYSFKNDDNNLKIHLKTMTLFGYSILKTKLYKRIYIYLLRVSEANEVPISSHIWVGLSTFNSL